MKALQTYMTLCSTRWRMVLGILLWIAVSSIFAQDSEESIRSRMSLTCRQYPDERVELRGLLRARIEGAYQKIGSEKVVFYTLDTAGNEVLIGEEVTKPDGIATVMVTQGDVSPDAEGYYVFMARFQGSGAMTESEADLRIRIASLIATPVAEDSIYSIHCSALASSPDGPQPVTDATIAVYVKRMFSQLKVGEGTTDESGEAYITFPNDLSGDDQGNLEITVLIEETEEYGDLISTFTQPWGKSVSYEITQLPRALWSPHPPWWMVITFFVLMGVVWIHYVIIVINLVRIKKHKKIQTAELNIGA